MVLSGPIQNQIGSATTYNADDRTNQVIVLADEREQPFFADLITKLDGAADPNTRTEVIFLQHATSKDVATLLTSVIAGQNSAAQKLASQSVRPGEVNAAPAGQPPRPMGRPTGRQAARGPPSSAASPPYTATTAAIPLSFPA